MLKLALIGAGQQGMVYGEAAQKSGLAEITAVAEPHTLRRMAAAKAFSIPPERVFTKAIWLMPSLSPPWTETITARPWLPWT